MLAKIRKLFFIFIYEINLGSLVCQGITKVKGYKEKTIRI